MSADVLDVLIVGAGLAGLSAARALGEAGLRVVVLDEGGQPGGRLATRALGAGWGDTGAQFFTTRSPEFTRQVAAWLAAGWVYEWSRGWSDGSLATAPPDGYPRYAARGGFRALAAHLAEGLDVRLLTRVVAVAPAGDGWRVETAGGESYAARVLLLTPPAPVALGLLAASDVALPAGDRAALSGITFGPCLCGLFAIDGETRLPPPGTLQTPGGPISWMADNQRKGISPEARVLTVHANSAASAAHWHDADDEALAWLADMARPWLAPGAAVRAGELARWPHAVPLTLRPERCWVSGLDTPLIFAGDAFGGPRVEGAVLSGWAAAAALRARL